MCEREIERERESERQRARKRERERDQRDSSWFSVQARVRAEINPFCGSQNFHQTHEEGGFESTLQVDEN